MTWEPTLVPRTLRLPPSSPIPGTLQLSKAGGVRSSNQSTTLPGAGCLPPATPSPRNFPRVPQTLTSPHLPVPAAARILVKEDAHAGSLGWLARGGLAVLPRGGGKGRGKAESRVRVEPPYTPNLSRAPAPPLILPSLSFLLSPRQRAASHPFPEALAVTTGICNSAPQKRGPGGGGGAEGRRPAGEERNPES